MFFKRSATAKLDKAVIRNLVVDADVVTSDGIRLGIVREIKRDRFRVGPSPHRALARGDAQPDFWLPTEQIHSADAARVLMSFPSERLGEIKIAELRAA